MLTPRALVFLLIAIFCRVVPAASQTEQPAPAASLSSGERIRIARITTPVVIDGHVTEDKWRGATRVEKWYETNPGDNLEPKVRNVGYLAYDDRYFYAAFEFDDPNPGAIRAPYADRDNVPSFTDYGGVIIDTRGDGQRAVMMLANPRGIQYDAISDDASGEDSSPDFFWNSAAQITDRGWTLEIRIPFSSLRYKNVDPQAWGIMLYRNWPREFRYQMFTARQPRDSNCFICHRNALDGLEHLPGGGHLVAAPFITSARNTHAIGDPGTPLVTDPLDTNIGLDAKWLPNAENAIDLTIHPDFSQVESDVAQITANERFALLFPEKRPFFLEGVDLFSTPIQAVYTRTITAPQWGARATGKEAGIRYTVLVADDKGGGIRVLPGPTESSTADVPFGSTVMVVRAKRDIGLSFVSVLATDRENNDGNGHNRVVGPDFSWRPAPGDVISGQWLYSQSAQPQRTDLSDQWTGQSLSGSAAMAQWNHSDTHLDWSGLYKNVDPGFRADTGFLPQVGYRQVNGSTGWTFRPTNFFSRVHTYLVLDHQAEQSGPLVSRQVMPAVGMDTRMNGYMEYKYIDERIRTGTQVLPRHLISYNARFSPSRVVAQLSVDGTAGRDIDFANSRPATGVTVNLGATLHPTDHLEVALIRNQRWLNVDTPTGQTTQLLTASISRIKSTYTFTSRMFVRAIAQYVSVREDPTLFITTVSDRIGNFGGQVLFAYKLNWQSVMFAGYGDARELTDLHRLAPVGKQLFIKLSYAIQR